MIDFPFSVYPKKLTYDGTQLHPTFAYKLANGCANAVIFRGPMKVKITEMIDAEDVIKNDPIWSDDAINIVAELPFTNVVGAVALQRMMIRVIHDNLNGGIHLRVDGDDLISGNYGSSDYRKYSVSIATQTAHSSLIHIGLNISAGKKAPSFAGDIPNIASLPFVTDTDVMNFMCMIADELRKEINSIYSATLKVLPL